MLALVSEEGMVGPFFIRMVQLITCLGFCILVPLFQKGGYVGRIDEDKRYSAHRTLPVPCSVRLDFPVRGDLIPNFTPLKIWRDSSSCLFVSFPWCVCVFVCGYLILVSVR